MNKKIFILPIILAILAGVWLATIPWRTRRAGDYLKIGDQFLTQNQPQAAVLEFRKAGLLLPRSPEIAYKVGAAYKQANDLKTAEKYFTKAQKLNSKEPKYYLELAQNLTSQNQPEKAILYLLEGAGKTGDNQDVLIWLGRVYLAQNEPVKAEKVFQKADSDYYLAVLAGFQGDFPNALEIIKNSSENSSEENSSEMKKALSHILEVSSQATKKIIFAQALNQLNDPAIGLVLLKKVTQDVPDYRDGWVFLGYSYLALDNLDEAEKALLSAADLDPINSLTFELLAQVYEAKGDSKKAQAFFAKAEMLAEK